MKRFITRLLLLLIPPLLVAALLMHVLYSPATLGWVSMQLQQRMAGLTIQNVRGTMLDGIHIDHLRIESGRALVVLDDVHVRVRWRCLLWGTACIKKLQAAQLLVTVKPSERPPSSSATALPAISTPIPLRWQKLEIGRLSFSTDADAPHLDAIRCGGSWINSKLFVDWGQLQIQQNNIELDGNIVFTDDYPVEIRTRLVNPDAGINLAADVGGDLAHMSALLQLEQPLRAQGTAAFSPLDRALPYRARLSLLTPYLWRPTQTQQITIADSATLEVHGDNTLASGELNAQVALPVLAQPASLKAPFQFDIGKSVLTVTPQLQAGKTQLDGNAVLTLGDAMTLAANATARHVDPGLWIAGLDGDIDASTRLTLQWNAGELTQASGELAARGSLQQDKVDLNLNGNWDRHAGWKLARGDAKFGAATLRLAAQGRATAARLQLVAAEPRAGNIDLKCNIEGIAEPELRASCEQLRWNAPAAWQLPAWHNQNPLRLSWASDRKLATLAPLCLRAGAASVCSDRELRWADGDINASIKIAAIDLGWAKAWLPANYALQGTLSGTIAALRKRENANMQWSVKLTTHDASVTLPTGDRKTTVMVRELRADIDSDDKRMAAVVNARADGFGDLDAALTMTTDQALQGKVTLREASLKALQPLMPKANITNGTLHANIDIAGTRAEPSLRGNLQLQHGEISAKQMSWPLKNIEARLDFEDRQAKLLASASINDQPFDVTGAFDWQQTLRGNVKLTAHELRVTPMPRMDFWVSPDITVTIDDGTLDISGRIDVPRAYIIIKELPKSGIAVSRDVIIVNDESLPKSPIPVTGKIEVALGDAVAFRGFGLQTRLEGNLFISFKDGQPEGNGRIKLVDGRYRAYGQLLDIRSGDLIFVGPLDNPVIRIEAIRSDVQPPNVVGVRADGELRSPDISLFSTPAMSERARVQYLLTGHAPDSDDPQDSSESALGSALLAFGIGESEGVVANVADKFGVHDVSLSTAESSTGGTQVQLSAYLNSRLYLRYGKSVFDNANEITMRYQLTKKLFVEGISGVANSLDLLWSLEFGRAEE